MNKIFYYAALTTLTLSGCTSKPEYDATGIFETTTVTISAETTGKVIELEVTEGDSVSAGERIALVDTTIFALQRQQLNFQRQSATSNSPDINVQIASLQTEISHQQQEAERFARLLADGATTAKQVADVNSRLQVLRNQLGALQSTLTKSSSSITDNAQAITYQIAQIDEQIAKSEIRSPLTGIVLEKYMEPGEFATPGRPVCKIGDLENVYLRAYFTAEQLADIKLGQEVTVIADFGGDEQFDYPGRITWIAQESEFTPKSIQTRNSRANLVYATKIAVKNDGRLKLGQYGEVKL